MNYTKHKIKVGVACIARKTFDFIAAKQIYTKLQEELNKIESIQWEFIPELVMEVEEAQHFAHSLNTKEIDAFICISGTFALGHLILEFNKIIQRPILLWGLDELPYDGGKIRLNSVCGVNLNASNLYKASITNYYVIIGEDFSSLNNWLDAIRILNVYNTAHIGIIGYRAHGFFNLDVDELDLYNQLGVLIDHYELSDLFHTEVTTEAIAYRKTQIQDVFNVSTLSEAQINKVAELTAKFDTFLKKNALTTLAIRCWPEFANDFGISPCAAMSLLQSEGKILTCEGDLLGSLSQLAHQAIGGETPFLADFSQVNFQEDFALLWHCGVAPCNLWDGKSDRSLDTYFAGGKGVTADFVMKAEPMSMVRLDYALGNYRLLLQHVQGVPMEKLLKGTYVKVTFSEGVRTFMDKLVYNGIAHHISCTYGDFIAPFEILAKIKNWKVIQ
jgi:L-fucose isomerase-like protein